MQTSKTIKQNVKDYSCILLLFLTFSCEEKSKDSISYYYHEDSSGVRERGLEVNGKKSGLWITVYGNGLVQSETFYLNNLKHGPCLIYHRNGTIGRVENYYNGKLDGNYENYVEGKLSSRGKFKNGLMEGHWKYYYEGRLARKVEYKNGQPIKTEEILKMPSTGRDLYELLESK